MRVLVIIPSAGSGSRFGGEVPKQYLELGGKPVLQHAVDRFLANPAVAVLVLAVAGDRVEAMRSDARWSDPRVRIVEGGATRQQSVTRALDAAEGQAIDVVAVHDAVRPFFTSAILQELLDAAEAYGASLPVAPVTDTIHVVADGLVVETLDRSRLGAAQTPQCFRIALLRTLLQRAAAEQFDGTDEAGLAVRYGFEVRAIAGDPMNFKITHARDLERAQNLLSEWREQ